MSALYELILKTPEPIEIERIRRLLEMALGERALILVKEV